MTLPDPMWAMSDATKQVFSEAVHEAVQEKQAEAKEDASRRSRGCSRSRTYDPSGSATMR
jgi:hypothetical protein